MRQTALTCIYLLFSIIRKYTICHRQTIYVYSVEELIIKLLDDS